MLTRYKRRGFIAKTVLYVVVLLSKKPGQEAPLDYLIVQHLIPEINPATNDRRIQDANAGYYE